VRKELEKEVAMCNKLQLGLAHRTVRWCTGQCPVRQAGPREKAALGTRRRRTAISHRTVRWCTGLSGESSAVNSSLSEKAIGRRGYNSPDCPVVHRTVRWANGRPRNPRATRGPQQRSVGHTGLSGVHRTVSGAPTDPEDQRSDAPEKEGDHAPDNYSNC
jgi:hypothetical protein